MKLPIKGLIKKTVFQQFCGGETIEESNYFAKKLHRNNICSILDYSVEGEGGLDDFTKTFEELKLVINEAACKPEYPFAVFKSSGIGLFSVLASKSANKKLQPEQQKHYDEIVERINFLCKLAYQNKVKLLIDAEETWIQDAVDEIVYKNAEEFNRDDIIIYNTIQLYRKGRIKEINKQIDLARKFGYKIGFKLVRGAYMEKEVKRAHQMRYPNPIQDTKKDSDNDYNQALKICFENRDIVAVMAGTHNEESSLLLAELIENNNISKSDDRFWFAQLYGMSDHISYNLAHKGFNVAKYLPYGPVKEVLPYLSRRAQENSSVKGQSSRELTLIRQELKRRKALK
ncbi:proline dehydrogenase family protein [Bacteroidia bacterium]|nr:proline dehydrogenase family protein [Bacteroidia bacterium]MDC0561205.1 proline dehydrogenase family protein [Bacteroidia bacterium]